MSRRRLAVCACAAAGLAACSSAGPSQSKLDRDEQRLVALYVRLTLLEKLHVEHPDAAEAGFRLLSTSYDSTAVRRTLQRLEQDPLRWEGIYDAISHELVRRQESPDPADVLPKREP